MRFATNVAARMYDVAAMRLDRPRVDLNFPEESRENTEFIVSDLRMVTPEEKMQDRSAYLQLSIRRDDEAAMAQLVWAKMDLVAERDAM